jgi:hypothetical protein
LSRCISGGNLTSLTALCKNGDNVQKRKIIGSIFSEKIVFGGENCRTNNLNSLVSLKLNPDKAFGQKKAGKKRSKNQFSQLCFPNWIFFESFC